MWIRFYHTHYNCSLGASSQFLFYISAILLYHPSYRGHLDNSDTDSKPPYISRDADQRSSSISPQTIMTSDRNAMMASLLAVNHPTLNHSLDQSVIQSLDMKSILFPSDRLTLGDIRRLFPTAYNILLSHSPQTHSSDVQADSAGCLHFVTSPSVQQLINTERLLVALSAAETNRSRDSDIAALTKTLAEIYLHLGVAKGEHEAKVLAHSLVIQGRRYARQVTQVPTPRAKNRRRSDQVALTSHVPTPSRCAY